MTKKNKGLVSVAVNKNEIEKLGNKIHGIPSVARKAGSYAYAEYLIGNKSRGLMHYSPYKYIKRKKAYGKTFQSDKQRRYVMARIRSGDIDPGVPHRTGRMQRGWGKPIRTRSGARITNAVKYAKWSHSNYSQARLNKLAGWRTVEQITKSNHAGAMRAFNLAVEKELKK